MSSEFSDSVLTGSDAVAVRYFFVPTLSWNGDVLSEGNAPTNASTRRLRLSDVHQFLSEHGQPPLIGAPKSRNPFRDYVQPILSFYQDVTIPFTTRRALPIVALCSSDGGPGGSAMPVEISIRWPITQLWEGREARIFLDDEQDNASSLVDSVSSIPAEMTRLGRFVRQWPPRLQYRVPAASSCRSSEMQLCLRKG